jgi:hypothetical protein
MEKDKEQRTAHLDMMEEDRREQSGQPLGFACILFKCDSSCSDCDHCSLVFQENKSMVRNHLHRSFVYMLLIITS